MPELQGAFPTQPDTGLPQTVNFALFDGGTQHMAWTTGNQNIFLLPSQPTIGKGWKIYSWGIQAQGMMMVSTLPPLGRLGKILASLVVGAGGITASFGPLGTVPFRPPPQAALPNLQTIWDGSTDVPFPVFDSVNANQPPLDRGHFAATFQLPIPQLLGPGERIAVGLWLTPSLVQSVINLALYNAQYTVTYDAA